LGLIEEFGGVFFGIIEEFGEELEIPEEGGEEICGDVDKTNFLGKSQ
jgi:hypothetical protein